MGWPKLTCYILTLLGGAGTLVFASGVLKARRARLEAVETRLEKLGGLDQQILDDRRVVDALETQLLSNRKEWGRVWPNAGQVAVVDRQQGVLELGIGAAAGLGVAARNGGALPNIHVFGIAGGDTQYVGEFQTTAVDAAQTVAKLERVPFEGEAEEWLFDGYRVREAIPESYNALVADLVTARNVASQDLLEERQRLQRAQAQQAASNELLDTRLAELNGDPSVDADQSEIRAKGLVKTLQERTSERDDLMAAVDRLRRKYSAKSDELKERLASVRSLAERLPGGGSVDSAENVTASTLYSVQ